MIKTLIKPLYFWFRRLLLNLIPRPKHLTLLSSENPRILVIRIDRVGDLALSTPLFRILRDNFPKADISVLVKPFNAEIILNDPAVNNVVPYEGFSKFLTDYGSKYDIVIDMINSHGLKTALLARSAQCPYNYRV